MGSEFVTTEESRCDVSLCELNTRQTKVRTCQTIVQDRAVCCLAGNGSAERSENRALQPVEVGSVPLQYSTIPTNLAQLRKVWIISRSIGSAPSMAGVNVGRCGVRQVIVHCEMVRIM